MMKADSTDVISFKTDSKVKTQVQINVKANLFVVSGATEMKRE